MKPLKTSKADLENKKFLFTEIGLIITLIILLLAFGWKSSDRNYSSSETRDFVEIQEEMVPITEQKIKLLPPPPSNTAVTIKIVEDDIDVEDDIVIDAEANQETEIEEYIPYESQELEEEEDIGEESIFVVVESMPTFPDGMNNLMRYLSDNIKYPSQAREMGIMRAKFLKTRDSGGVGSYVDFKVDWSTLTFEPWNTEEGGAANFASHVQSNMPNTQHTGPGGMTKTTKGKSKPTGSDLKRPSTGASSQSDEDDEGNKKPRGIIKGLGGKKKSLNKSVCF